MIVGLIAAAALTSAFVWSIVAAGRDPRRFEPPFQEARWRSIRAWVLGLSLAILAGTALGGASNNTLATIAVVGVLLGWLCDRFLGAGLRR